MHDDYDAEHPDDMHYPERDSGVFHASKLEESRGKACSRLVRPFTLQLEEFHWSGESARSHRRSVHLWLPISGIEISNSDKSRFFAVHLAIVLISDPRLVVRYCSISICQHCSGLAGLSSFCKRSDCGI